MTSDDAELDEHTAPESLSGGADSANVDEEAVSAEEKSANVDEEPVNTDEELENEKSTDTSKKNEPSESSNDSVDTLVMI